MNAAQAEAAIASVVAHSDHSVEFVASGCRVAHCLLLDTRAQVVAEHFTLSCPNDLFRNHTEPYTGESP